jgi:hypothetical protein
MTWAPAGLAAGTHLTADEGRCLMEAVSAAAGLPWSDAPACTHPLLGRLARLVNDASSDEGRRLLEPLVPQLALARPGDPGTAARASARLALACTAYAVALRPTLLPALLHRQAAAQLARETGSDDPGRPGTWVARVRRRLFASGPGARSVEAAVDACCHLH